jgi:hypothetical protein
MAKLPWLPLLLISKNLAPFNLPELEGVNTHGCR